MSKKIKIIIATLIAIIIAGIANAVMAEQIHMDNAYHFSPINEGTTQYLFCKQHGQPESDYVVPSIPGGTYSSYKSAMATINSWMNGLGENIFKKGNIYYTQVSYSETSSKTNKNDEISYILSSGTESNILNKDSRKGNYKGLYSDKAAATDIQYALWCDPNFNDKNAPGGTAAENPGIGKYLYEEALKYQQFYNANVKDGYSNHVTVDTKDCRVTVSQDTGVNTNDGYYILGPISITYPEDNSFAYMNNIYINYTAKDSAGNDQNYMYNVCTTYKDGVYTSSTVDSNGNIIKNDVSNTNEIIKMNNTSDPYPHSGEKFFIKVKAANIGYSTKISIGATIKYLKETTSEYKLLTGTLSGKTLYAKAHPTANGVYYTIEVKDVGTMPSQELIRTTLYQDDTRIWEDYHTDRDSSHPNNKIVIDLSMNMGGKVWSDINADVKQGAEAKDNLPNGVYNSETDKLMPNVTVTLYRQGYDNEVYKVDGTECITKTDKNGEYTFNGLNSMYKYYVKYTYNGQYYQPTRYLMDSDTNWNNNSKAMDKYDQRDSYNNKFAEIGSSPHNYKSGNDYNKTFSLKYLKGYRLQQSGKYELTATPVVDDYGNLIVNIDNNGNVKKWDYSNKTMSDENWNTSENVTLQNLTIDELKQMIQYVKDCQMDSYTSDGTNLKYYPIDNHFIITDEYPNATAKENSAYPEKNENPTYNILPQDVETEFISEFGNEAICIYNLHMKRNVKSINLGLTARETSDLAIRKDVYKATTEINGKTETYTYNKRQGLTKDSNGNEYWDIDVRISDAYYDSDYSRELYREDYDYKVNQYENDAMKGTTSSLGYDKELQVYVTYKINIKNQSGTIDSKVMELVDYYDQEYTLIGSDNKLDREANYKPYIGDVSGNKTAEVTTSNNSRYGAQTQSTISGYNTTYITGLDKSPINASSDMYVYLTFRVNKKDNNVILDEQINGSAIGVGKENIIEVNGYTSTYTNGIVAPNTDNTNTSKGAEYVAGDNAGIVDTDSNPGNITESNSITKDGKVDYSKFEDDTDKAPNTRIILNRTNVRIANGTVWDDTRNKQEQSSQIGNGTKDEKENGVNGVIVQFVELVTGTDGKTYEHIWQQYKSGETKGATPIINVSGLIQNYDVTGDGKYQFESFAPGNYIVRFIYGSNGDTKDYNGQDYKSTIYQTGVTNDNAATAVSTGTYDYKFSEADGKSISDAKDIWDRRQAVNNYCNNSGNGVTNTLATELNGHDTDNFYKNTYMIAETGKIDVNFEYNRKGTGIEHNNTSYTNTSATGNSNVSSDNYTQCGYYEIKDLDLGLTERPKAQLKTTKQVVNVKVILANGNSLFDATQKATNVLWQNKKAYAQDQNNTYTEKDNYENKYLMKMPAVRQVVSGSPTGKGKIQLTMDEELMHGATIKITYAIFVANVGEVDYKDATFYYTGSENDATGNIVKTKVNNVIDYVGYQDSTDDKITRNNLKFIKDENENWSVITTDDAKAFLNGTLYQDNDNKIAKYATMIQNNLGNKELKPILADQGSATAISGQIKTNPLTVAKDVQDKCGSVAATNLVLSQTLSSENSSDDMTYNNMVEIVSINNTVGRRMAYSIVGNQDPTIPPSEIDADEAEEVTILPPFGQTHIYYYLIAGIAAIAIVGIVLIKKKVFKRKK